LIKQPQKSGEKKAKEEKEEKEGNKKIVFEDCITHRRKSSASETSLYSNREEESGESESSEGEGRELTLKHRFNPFKNEKTLPLKKRRPKFFSQDSSKFNCKRELIRENNKEFIASATPEEGQNFQVKE